MAPTLMAFASIHQNHLLIFSKMMDMKMEVTLAKKMIALFIHLSQLDLGFKILFENLSLLETYNPHLLQFFGWGHYFLSSLVTLPQFFTIFYSTADDHYFRRIPCERESLYRGLNEGLYGTYKGLFEDILKERGLNAKILNPNAKEWCPSAEIEEESRFLFITFSKGLPLTNYQIRVFFTWWFGPYVETIYIHRRGGGFPLFGKIVFRFSFVPHLILNGRERVDFVFNSRTLRCKKFIRRIKPNP